MSDHFAFSHKSLESCMAWVYMPFSIRGCVGADGSMILWDELNEICVHVFRCLNRWGHILCVLSKQHDTRTYMSVCQIFMSDYTHKHICILKLCLHVCAFVCVYALCLKKYVSYWCTITVLSTSLCMWTCLCLSFVLWLCCYIYNACEFLYGYMMCID